MHRGRLAILLAGLTVIAALAVAGPTPQNPDGQPTGVRDSECYRCHGQGGGAFGPPLRSVVHITPVPDQTFTPGEPMPYRVDLENAWTAQVSDVIISLDIADAPSFGFSPGKEPHHASDTATLPVTLETGERTAEVTLEVPPGATEFRVRMAPATQDGTFAPDLTLRAWAPGQDTDGPPSKEVDAGGTGQGEAFSVRGSQAIADLGFGDWTLQAAQDALGTDPSTLQDQDVTFTLDAWFNTTGETVQYLSSDVEMDGLKTETTPQSIPFAWDLVAVQTPGDEEFHLRAEVTANYDHPGSVSEGWDTWRFQEEVSIVFTAPVAGQEPNNTGVSGEVQPGNDTLPDDLGPQKDPVPWDRIGETIGYTSATLILVSMVTGGVFGKASRRGMNRLFRSAKRRVAFHNFLSYIITLLAIAHTVLFIWEPGFRWTLGLIWGGGALIAMLLVGVTGFLQVPLIRAMNFGVWRWSHLLLAIATLLLSVAHMLLDGIHFVDFAETVGWHDPLVGVSGWPPTRTA